jgi:hypothetical protein
MLVQRTRLLLKYIHLIFPNIFHLRSLQTHFFAFQVSFMALCEGTNDIALNLSATKEGKSVNLN